MSLSLILGPRLYFSYSDRFRGNGVGSLVEGVGMSRQDRCNLGSRVVRSDHIVKVDDSRNEFSIRPVSLSP